MPRCFACEAEVPARTIDYEAHLLPRTAGRGGPLTLLSCPECGQVNLVERNPAGETLLTPPIVRGHTPPDLKGAALATARRWVAEHGMERAEFLARRKSTLPHAAAAAPDTPPVLTPLPEEDPEMPPPASGPVTDLLEAYAVLDLPLTATVDEVKSRYRKLARACHPDRVADLDEEIRRVAERKFRRLQTAYDLIAKECPPEPPGSR